MPGPFQCLYLGQRQRGGCRYRQKGCDFGGIEAGLFSYSPSLFEFHVGLKLLAVDEEGSGRKPRARLAMGVSVPTTLGREYLTRGSRRYGAVRQTAVGPVGRASSQSCSQLTSAARASKSSTVSSVSLSVSSARRMSSKLEPEENHSIT